MKIALIFQILLVGCLSVFAQENAVPEQVKKDFKKQFKHAESPSWYVENQDYEVQFLQDGIEKVAYFAKSDGLFLELKELIAEDDIPTVVMAKVRDIYPFYILKEYSKITPLSGTARYELTIESETELYAVQIDQNGALLKNDHIQ